MIIELLTPGVEHHDETGRALPAAAGQLEQTFRRRVEEQLVERGLIPQEQRVQRAGQSEDEVKVRDRQQPAQLLLQPMAGMAGLTTGTMPVPATQGQGLAVAAAPTPINGVPQRAGAAQAHALEKAPHARGQTRMSGQEIGQETAPDCAEVQPFRSARRQMLASRLHDPGRLRAGVGLQSGVIDQVQRRAHAVQARTGHVQIAGGGEE